MGLLSKLWKLTWNTSKEDDCLVHKKYKIINNRRRNLIRQRNDIVWILKADPRPATRRLIIA